MFLAPLSLPKHMVMVQLHHYQTHGLFFQGADRMLEFASSPDEEIMETSALAQPASDRYPQVASPLHTILMLAALAAWTFGAKILADHNEDGG